VDRGEYNEVAKLPARNTSMGARTWVHAVLVERGDIRVRRGNYSKSGRHWVDYIFATGDAKGVVYIVDYTNSGKSESYKLYIEGGRVVAKELWDPSVEKVPSGARITSPYSAALRV